LIVILPSSKHLLEGRLTEDYPPPADNSMLLYRSSVEVFAGRVREIGFFQKAGFPQNPFMPFAK